MDVPPTDLPASPSSAPSDLASGSTAGFPAGTAGFPFGTAGFPFGAAGFPFGTAGFPFGTAGFPFGIEALGELTTFTAPVTGDNPTGADLRQTSSPTSLYYRLRELRTGARNRERAALAGGEADFIETTDWLAVIEAVPPVLATESKDLELVAWLIEALTRVHGFRGVAAGFTLAAALIERYGEQLHPQPDDEGVASQFAALSGLNGFGSEGALIVPLKSIPITQGSPPAPFSTWQCEQAYASERMPDARQAAREKRGFVMRNDLDQALAETTPRYFQQLAADIAAASDAFHRYRNTVDAHCAAMPQPTARILETLDTIAQTLRHIAGDKLTVVPEQAMDASGTAPGTNDNASGASPPLNERGAALRQLREVAAFFRRSEPHSPISYAVEQAVYWSNLSLPELIGELIPDDTARERFRVLTGIRSAEPRGSEK